MKFSWHIFLICWALLLINACSSDTDIVRITTVTGGSLNGFEEAELARIAEILEEKKRSGEDSDLKSVIQATPNYSINEYLIRHPDANNPTAQNYALGG
ncbi:hypothetical protein ACFL0O_09315, partial [Thermodesulfobacteriota bacterium]